MECRFRLMYGVERLIYPRIMRFLSHLSNKPDWSYVLLGLWLSMHRSSLSLTWSSSVCCVCIVCPAWWLYWCDLTCCRKGGIGIMSSWLMRRQANYGCEYQHWSKLQRLFGVLMNLETKKPIRLFLKVGPYCMLHVLPARTTRVIWFLFQLWL